MDLTDDEGLDAAIEALGTSGTFKQCITVTKAGGTISNVAYHGEVEHVNIPREDGVLVWPRKISLPASAPVVAFACNGYSACWNGTALTPLT